MKWQTTDQAITWLIRGFFFLGGAALCWWLLGLIGSLGRTIFRRK